YAPDPALLAQIVTTGRVPLDEKKPATLGEIDAADLGAEPDEDGLVFLPLFEREGYFVRGWSHVLAGYPRCGKTELLVTCCRAWLELGETILYVTEESRPLWRQRMRRVSIRRGMRLLFGFGAPKEALYDRIRMGTETIVIIDTLRGLQILSGD